MQKHRVNVFEALPLLLTLTCCDLVAVQAEN